MEPLSVITWISKGATWIRSRLGLVQQQRNNARGAVLRNLSRIHSLVNQVCAGDIRSDSVAGTSFQDFDALVETARQTLNEQSQWVGPEWLRDVERLIGLGKSAITRYRLSQTIRGDSISGQAMNDAHRDCQEFKTLFEKIRG
jgi:hypothetical protein